MPLSSPELPVLWATSVFGGRRPLILALLVPLWVISRRRRAVWSEVRGLSSASKRNNRTIAAGVEVSRYWALTSLPPLVAAQGVFLCLLRHQQPATLVPDE